MPTAIALITTAETPKNYWNLFSISIIKRNYVLRLMKKKIQDKEKKLPWID